MIDFMHSKMTLPKLYIDVPATPGKCDFLYTNFLHNYPSISIRQRSDYVTLVTGPNKSYRNSHGLLCQHTIYAAKFEWKATYIAMYVAFPPNFATYIVCRCNKPCEFLGFVWPVTGVLCNHFSGEYHFPKKSTQFCSNWVLFTIICSKYTQFM